MKNPFKGAMDFFRGLWKNELVRGVFLEATGNEIYGALRGGDGIPESAKTTGTAESAAAGQGANLKTGRAAFTQKDEAAYGLAMAELKATQGAAFAIMSKRFAELGTLGFRSARVTIALYQDNQERVDTIFKWSEMDDEEWSEFVGTMGFDKYERFKRLVKKAWDKLKELDAKAAEKLQQAQSETDQESTSETEVSDEDFVSIDDLLAEAVEEVEVEDQQEEVRRNSKPAWKLVFGFTAFFAAFITILIVAVS